MDFFAVIVLSAGLFIHREEIGIITSHAYNVLPVFEFSNLNQPPCREEEIRPVPVELGNLVYHVPRISEDCKRLDIIGIWTVPIHPDFISIIQRERAGEGFSMRIVNMRALALGFRIGIQLDVDAFLCVIILDIST